MQILNFSLESTLPFRPCDDLSIPILNYFLVFIRVIVMLCHIMSAVPLRSSKLDLRKLISLSSHFLLVFFLSRETETLTSTRFFCLIVGCCLLQKWCSFAWEPWDKFREINTMMSIGTWILRGCIRLTFGIGVYAVKPSSKWSTPKAVWERSAFNLSSSFYVIQTGITVLTIDGSRPSVN